MPLLVLVGILEESSAGMKACSSMMDWAAVPAKSCCAAALERWRGVFAGVVAPEAEHVLFQSATPEMFLARGRLTWSSCARNLANTWNCLAVSHWVENSSRCRTEYARTKFPMWFWRIFSTFKSRWVIGLCHWCYPATAFATSQKICNTFCSLNPFGIRTFISGKRFVLQYGTKLDGLMDSPGCTR